MSSIEVIVFTDIDSLTIPAAVSSGVVTALLILEPDILPEISNRKLLIE